MAVAMFVAAVAAALIAAIGGAVAASTWVSDIPEEPADPTSCTEAHAAVEQQEARIDAIDAELVRLRDRQQQLGPLIAAAAIGLVVVAGIMVALALGIKVSWWIIAILFFVLLALIIASAALTGAWVGLQQKISAFEEEAPEAEARLTELEQMRDALCGSGNGPTPIDPGTLPGDTASI